MFKKKKAEPSAELVLLKKVYAEIRDMQKDLDMIIGLLQDLKVYIDQRQIQFIANTLSSKINTVNLFLIGWLESGKGNIEEQFASIHEIKSLLGQYGFAHIHVYMLAFQKELDLCHWLGRGENFKSALLEDSRQYFIDALNPAYHLDTPARILHRTNNAIADLTNRFQPGNFTQEVSIKIKKTCACGEDGFRLVLFTLAITGSIDEGFSFSFSEKILRIEGPTCESCRGGGGGHGGGGHKNYFSKLEKTLASVSSPANNLDQKVAEYNSARELYLNYYKSKLELEATLKTIKDVVQLIDSKGIFKSE